MLTLVSIHRFNERVNCRDSCYAGTLFLIYLFCIAFFPSTPPTPTHIHTHIYTYIDIALIFHSSATLPQTQQSFFFKREGTYENIPACPGLYHLLALHPGAFGTSQLPYLTVYVGFFCIASWFAESVSCVKKFGLGLARGSMSLTQHDWGGFLA